MKSFFLFLFAATYVQLTIAAPIPATSSSSFIDADMGLFRSPEGFSIHAGKTGWVHEAPPKDHKYIVTVYKSPHTFKGVRAALTVRVDQLDFRRTLKDYMKKWKLEYPRLGFSVLKSKMVRVNKKRAYLIDLAHEGSSKQLRQVVFLKKKKAVILTCRGHKKEFQKSSKDCNQLIRNFAWL